VSSGEPRKIDLPPVVPALLSALTEAYGRLPNDIGAFFVFHSACYV
jgi:hypothetical protein